MQAAIDFVSQTPLYAHLLGPMNSVSKWEKQGGAPLVRAGRFLGHQVTAMAFSLVALVESIAYLALAILTAPLVIGGFKRPFCYLAARTECTLECGNSFFLMEKAKYKSLEDARNGLKFEIEKQNKSFK